MTPIQATSAYPPGLLTLIEKERLATIERCAQVADSFRERFFNHPMEMADAIAAAIRALKDKPTHEPDDDYADRAEWKARR